MAKIDLDKTKVVQDAPKEYVSKKTATNAKELNAEEQFVFTNDNWKWVFIGIALIVIGFVLMWGGKSADPNVFDEKEIYSARRIIVAPILVVAGFMVEIYAIVKKYVAK